jgi:hypothetical protein
MAEVKREKPFGGGGVLRKITLSMRKDVWLRRVSSAIFQPRIVGSSACPNLSKIGQDIVSRAIQIKPQNPIP